MDRITIWVGNNMAISILAVALFIQLLIIIYLHCRACSKVKRIKKANIYAIALIDAAIEECEKEHINLTGIKDGTLEEVSEQMAPILEKRMRERGFSLLGNLVGYCEKCSRTVLVDKHTLLCRKCREKCFK